MVQLLGGRSKFYVALCLIQWESYLGIVICDEAIYFIPYILYNLKVNQVYSLPMLQTKNLTLITPKSQFSFKDLVELWAYRHLIYMLVTRTIKTRYKQTIFGFVWPVLQPLIMMLIYAFIFGELAKLPTDGNLPHNLFIYSGMIPWTFFANGLSSSTNSLVGNSDLMTKVYFPRLAFPVVGVLTGVFDMLVSLGILFIMMLWYGYYPTIQIIFLPLFLGMAGLIAFALGLWFSALNVSIRDVGFGIAFLLRVWLYATPVAYSSKVLPVPYNQLYILNPIASVVDGFRWALFPTEVFPLAGLLISLIVVIIILIGGLFYFRRVEANFADVI